MADFKVGIKAKKTGVYVVMPEGRLASDTYRVLDKKIVPLLAPSTQVIIFDMKRLDYISSAGLSIIFKVVKALKENDGTYIMINLKPQIKKIFEIVSALPSMHIFENIGEVDDYLDTMQRREIEKQKSPG